MEYQRSVIIRTPEGIAFPLVLAGPTARFLAWLLDLACVFGLASLAGTILAVLGVLSADLASAATIIGYFVITIGYSIALEWKLRGQTIGKRVLGIRVMDQKGRKLTFSQVVVRNLLRFVDEMPVAYMLGGISCLVSRRTQRLGDLAAGTIVMAHPKVAEPDLSMVAPEKYNSFRQYPIAQARLRQKTPPSQAGLALSALVRRNDLEPRARQEIFKEMADYFRALVSFPAQATDGLSNEAYVKNVVDVLFRA